MATAWPPANARQAAAPMPLPPVTTTVPMEASLFIATPVSPAEGSPAFLSSSGPQRRQAVDETLGRHRPREAQRRRLEAAGGISCRALRLLLVPASCPVPSTKAASAAASGAFRSDRQLLVPQCARRDRKPATKPKSEVPTAEGDQPQRAPPSRPARRRPEVPAPREEPGQQATIARSRPKPITIIPGCQASSERSEAGSRARSQV